MRSCYILSQLYHIVGLEPQEEAEGQERKELACPGLSRTLQGRVSDHAVPPSHIPRLETRTW